MPALNFKGGVVQCHESGSHVGRWLISRALARRLDGSAACSTAPTIRLLAHEVKGQKNTPGGSRPPGVGQKLLCRAVAKVADTPLAYGSAG